MILEYCIYSGSSLDIRTDSQIKSTKAGKYTITVRYTFRGQAVNTAPQTVKITASVRDIKPLTFNLRDLLELF